MDRNELISMLEAKAKKLRRGVIVSIGVGLAGHVGGSCSSADIVSALYFYKMHYDPKNPKMKDRDRFLLSKGHVAILQYTALAEAGFFPYEELAHTKEIGSMLQGHPDVQKTPGIEAGTGSLGQGLSIALGMSFGMKLDRIENRKVYVLIGDGELDEGQNWEAAMACAAHKADNVCAIVDRNRLQATGKIGERFPIEPIDKKFEAFGWNVIEIDGHNIGEIIDALDKSDSVKDKPTVIIANTIKGKGVSFAENVVSFHNGLLSEEQYRQALIELS